MLKRPEEMTTTTSGAPLVPVHEVMSLIGYGPDMLPECAGWAGVQPEVVEDWTGERCMTVENAARLVSGAQDYMQRHYAKWDAYRSYLEERKRVAKEERQKRATLEREAAQRVAKERRELWTEEMARKTEQDIAEREAAKAKREGMPMSPEQFFRQAG